MDTSRTRLATLYDAANAGSHMKDNDAAWREAEERFRQSFELGLVGMAITSPSKGWLEVNDKMCEILGYERRELLQLTWVVLTHPDDVGADVEKFDKVLAGELDAYAMDKRFIRKDGRVIHASISVRCHRDAQGAVDYFLAILQDISERVHAEEAVRRSRDELAQRVDERTRELLSANAAMTRELSEHHRTEALLRDATTSIKMILDSVTDQFFAFDSEWRFDYLNEHARKQMRALGKDPDALIGAVLWDTLADVPNEATLRRVMSERIAITDELYYAPLGHWVENHMYPTPSGGVVTFQKYITERKQAEQALRRSQEYIDEIQRLSHTGSAAWNVVTGAVYWSDETCRIYGVEPGTVTPCAKLFFSRAVHPEDRARLEQAFERVVRDKSDYELQFRVVHPDGAIHHIHSVGRSVLDDAGNLQEVVGTVTDVTERIRMEEALHKTRAELAHVRRIAMLGELTSLITHEVSQPLSSILADGSAALRWLCRDPPNLAETKQAVERVVREGNRAGDVIKRLRSLAAKTGTQMDWLQVNEPVLEMVSLVQSELINKRISLRLELASSLPPVLGDRVQVAEVILNLMMNAIEAMAGVNDRSREISLVTQLYETDQVLVCVSDSGVGLAAQQLARIFDSFVTTKPGGMGLGLSISRTIVENHGGRLWAATNPEHGATLSFTLPVAGSDNR